jgi:hypothetical protein
VYKTCGRCRQTLPEAAFNRAGEGRQHWCRECFRSYFQQRGELHLRQVKASRERRKKPLRAFVLSHLQANPCTDCRESDIRVLEFDHVGVKGAEVAQLVYSGVPLQRLKTEVGRCEVVCRNCHRRRTAMRAGWRRLVGETVPRTLRSRQRRNLDWMYARLAASRCVDCGINDPLILEFDHVGEKRANVCVLAWGEYSLRTLEREIAQCQVRCCNCHRRRTAEADGWFRATGGLLSQMPP